MFARPEILQGSPDVLRYHSPCSNNTLDTKIYGNPLDTLNASAALLSAACRHGLVRPVATKVLGEAMLQGDWDSYLSDLVGSVDTLTPSRDLYKNTFDIALSEVSTELGMEREQVFDQYTRNIDCDQRKPEEYPVYERLRSLHVQLSELYAFLEAGCEISTSSNKVRKTVSNVLGAHGLITSNEIDDPMLPVVRKVTFDPTPFNVGDIVEMVESRQLLEKLGAMDLVFASQGRSETLKGFAKDMTLYLLGLIPGIGTIANILGAMNLLEEARTLLTKANDKESILYFDETGVHLAK